MSAEPLIRAGLAKVSILRVRQFIPMMNHIDPGFANCEVLLVILPPVNPHLPASNASDGANRATNRYNVCVIKSKVKTRYAT